jgi:molybdenum cofactor cytidylyltransferase
MGDIGGMVLAAGISERMAGPLPKQLLPLSGATLVAVTVRHAEASRLDRVVVVTGHRSSEVAQAVTGGRARVVENPDYRQGNMTSFRVGATALAGCEACVILLADMPDVTAAMIDEMVTVWRRDRPWAAVASYWDRRAHPLLLSAAAMEEVCAAEGPKGVWRFLAAAPPGHVADVVFDRSMPADVNTAADYERLLRAHGSD